MYVCMYVIKLGNFKQCVVPLCERLKTSEEKHTIETVMVVLTLMCASETRSTTYTTG
jgi:hypothetical protein